MKKHITAITLAAIFLIIIPLLTVNFNYFGNRKAGFNSYKENKTDYLTGILASEFREDYCEEGLKAVAIILNSNYNSGVKLNSISKDEFLKKHKNGERYYSKIEKTSEEYGNTIITYKGKPVTVPFSYVTNGDCQSDYAYIRNTANPRDLINAGYTFDSEPGVSLNSINELCKRGLSCEEALNRYFKKISIVKQ